MGSVDSCIADFERFFGVKICPVYARRMAKTRPSEEEDPIAFCRGVFNLAKHDPEALREAEKDQKSSGGYSMGFKFTNTHPLAEGSRSARNCRSGSEECRDESWKRNADPDGLESVFRFPS